MALVRLPFRTPLSLQNPHKSNHINNSPFLLPSLSSHSSVSDNLTLFVRTQRINNFVFKFSVTTQDPVVNFSSANVSPGTQELLTETEQEEEFSRTRLLAQNVPWTCTTEDIRALFERFGTVLDVELSMHNKTRNRGLAFVTMGSPEEALAALNNLESYEYEGRILRVNFAKPKKKRTFPTVQPKPVPTFNLFVANLSYEARAKDLREFFSSENRNVVSAEVIFHDNPRKSSGYGFVSFKSKKEAEDALSAFNGKELMGRPIRVARSRQFVKVQTKEGLESDDTATELNTDAEQVEMA